MALYDHTVDNVAETLQKGRDRGIKCCLLIGAGCSRSAGIPLASEFIEEVKRQYPNAYAKATPQTYAQCMAALSQGERYDLIREYIERAKVNPAHLAIAQLVDHGFVDRVLTTNFDPLVNKACGLINTPIAIYDFAAAQTFNPGDTQANAIFHLHGQHTGFRLLNTEEECNSLRHAIQPLFEDSGKRRIWIVVGYSGDQDPVFEQLARMERFEHRLYWVLYKDAAPSFHVRMRLLLPEKYAFYVNGYDADGFFTKLAETLDCYPPAFMSQPFTHLEKLFAEVRPHTGSSFEPERLTALRMIGEAKEKYETEANQNLLRLQSRLWLGDEDKLVAELEAKRKGKKLTDEERDVLALAYSAQGTNSVKDKGYEYACTRFDAALAISPGKPEVLNDWAVVITDHALTKNRDEQIALLTDSVSKCEAAVKSPIDATPLGGMTAHFCYANWARALFSLAQSGADKDRESFLNAAEEKCRLAIKSDANVDFGFYIWGDVLYLTAKAKEGPAQELAYRDACEKYAKATEIKKDCYWAFNNWGLTLFDWAERKEGEPRKELLRQACEKFEKATKINGDYHEGFNNWGFAQYVMARAKEGDEKEQLLRDACQKFERATQINADYHLAIDNWGAAQLQLLRLVDDEEKRRILQETRDMLEKSEAAEPGSCTYNLACLAALEENNDACRKWIEACGEHGKLPPAEHLRADKDLAYVRRRKWFRDLLKRE